MKRLKCGDGSVSVNTIGETIVIPSGNSGVLPLFNEYVLSSNRLTIAESPYGGLINGADYCPGSVYCLTSGVQITDVTGGNAGNMLSAGVLKNGNWLSVDSTAHTITQEFIISNVSTSHSPTVIINGNAVSGWFHYAGSNEVFTSENGRIKITGTTDASGYFFCRKTAVLDLSAKHFITLDIESSLAGNVYFGISSSTNNNKVWETSRLPLSANTNTHFVFPVQAPGGVSGSNPSSTPGSIVMSTIANMYIGVAGATPNASITLYVDNVATDDAKQVYVELQTPDTLADTSAQISFYNGSSYLVARTCKLNTAFESVSVTSANSVHLDATTYDDAYGSGNGRSVFPKGSSGNVKAGSLTNSSITYSANKGTKNRIGFLLNLPPVSSRANFSKVRMRVVLYYAANSLSTYEFNDSTNSSYGLQNLVKPWIALYDPASSTVDFFLFTYRPKQLSFQRDEKGTVTSLTLFSGNGMVYHGQITYADLTLDSDSNLIPNFLEGTIEGSLTKFLASYGMII